MNRRVRGISRLKIGVSRSFDRSIACHVILCTGAMDASALIKLAQVWELVSEQVIFKSDVHHPNVSFEVEPAAHTITVFVLFVCVC